ncbi:unnamed protein product [Gongylonema pulchrum]|uniref:Uncharacterized protein n=1 Tax=Gongylonema pulchrum TaxID=637853 RepID=A0A183ENT5_9BILA|nr:unnamed protein product [Gongylonema pulchrum]
MRKSKQRRQKTTVVILCQALIQQILQTIKRLVGLPVFHLILRIVLTSFINQPEEEALQPSTSGTQAPKNNDEIDHGEPVCFWNRRGASVSTWRRGSRSGSEDEIRLARFDRTEDDER